MVFCLIRGFAHRLPLPPFAFVPFPCQIQPIPNIGEKAVGKAKIKGAGGKKLGEEEKGKEKQEKKEKAKVGEATIRGDKAKSKGEAEQEKEGKGASRLKKGKKEHFPIGFSEENGKKGE